MSVRQMNFWGWGWADEAEAEDAEADLKLARSLAKTYGVGDIEPLTRPGIQDFAIPASRLKAPNSLAGICSTDDDERLIHSLGKSYADLARAAQRKVDHFTDMVAFPESEQEVCDLLDWAAGQNIAVIPFGGGSTVCGGVEPDVGDQYAGVLTVNLRRMDKVLEVDRVSRAARIQGGVLGPDLEAQLKEHGYTLRT